MAEVRVHRQEIFLAEAAGGGFLDSLGYPGDRATESELLHLGDVPDTRAPRAQRLLELGDAETVRCDHAETRDDHPPRHAATPIPESRPEQTSVPSSRCMR